MSGGVDDEGQGSAVESGAGAVGLESTADPPKDESAAGEGASTQIYMQAGAVNAKVDDGVADGTADAEREALFN